MASRPDRREHVEQQLAALGLVGTRIDAVTPTAADLPPDSPLSAGELGCSRSHQKIWQMLVEQDIPAALILEDDVLLSVAIRSVLSDPHLLEGGVDAVQFEAHATTALVGRPRPSAVPGITRNRLMSSSLGAAAYVMTRGLAQRLLQRNDLDEMPVDSLLFGRQSGLLYEANICQLVPALAIQLDHTAAGRRDAARSDLTAQRAPSRSKNMPLAARLRRIARHWGNHLRIVSAFGTSGDLRGARHLRLPVAPDLQHLL